MYRWRQLNGKQRKELLEYRKQRQQPWHSPPHRQSERLSYHLTAACFNHAPIIGRSPDRMAAFEATLLETLGRHTRRIAAWCVLPNHYHTLIETEEVLALIADIGKMHGRLSFQWNGEDDARGRKTWFNCVERTMRTDRHFWATLNYVHNNPVHHGYVEHWQDWPFSSAAAWLAEVGRESAMEIWRKYPVLDYGKGWDDAAL